MASSIGTLYATSPATCKMATLKDDSFVAIADYNTNPDTSRIIPGTVSAGGTTISITADGGTVATSGTEISGVNIQDVDGKRFLYGVGNDTAGADSYIGAGQLDAGLITLGAKATVSTGGAGLTPITFSIDDSGAFVFGYYNTAQQIAGGILNGIQVQINTQDTVTIAGNPALMFSLGQKKFGLAYSTPPNLYVAYGGIKVNGASISLTPLTTSSALGTMTLLSGLIKKSDSGQVIVTGAGAGGVDFKAVASNIVPIAGVMKESGTAGQTKLVQTAGAENSSQTGLTAGLDYWVHPLGTLDASPWLDFAGVASAATKMVLGPRATRSAEAMPRSYSDQAAVFAMNQASMYAYGEWTPTAGCVWTGVTGADGSPFPALAACTQPSGSGLGGKATAPATKIPEITLTEVEAAEYEVCYHGVSFANGSGSGRIQLYFGSTKLADAYLISSTANTYQAGQCGRITINAPLGATNVGIRHNMAGGTGILLYNSGSNESFGISVKKFPLSNRLATTPDMTPGSWSGYHGNSTPVNCNWNTTSTSFVNPGADADCNLTERTNSNFGTVTSYVSGSDELPGIVFTPKRTGRYYVCAITQTANSAATGTTTVRLTDGTTVVAVNNMQASGADNSSVTPLCGVYPVISITEKTLRVEIAANGNTAYIKTGGSLSNHIEWSIFYLDNIPAPVIVAAPQSHIRLDTFNSTSTQFGSTDTGVFRYTNVRENTGNSFTHATSAANGSTVTINNSGLYCANTNYLSDGSAAQVSVTVNGTTLTTSTGAASTTQTKCYQYNTGSGAARNAASCYACFSAVAGDIVRAQGAGTTDQNSTTGSFLDIIKMNW
jgi:hypothetical protein